MYWYLVYTKPRQERCALENLERQGFECYLPTFPSEKVRQGQLAVSDEPLFPRYLFIRPRQEGTPGSWGCVRSTRGVSRLVCFASEPAKVEDSLVQALRRREAGGRAEPQRWFRPGDRVRLTEVPFAGIEGIFQLADGDRRVMVLIELLSKPVIVRTSPASLRKEG